MLIQMRDLNPVTAPIWLAGLAAFAFWDRFANLRAIAIAYVLVLVAMIALHAKSYYHNRALSRSFRRRSRGIGGVAHVARARAALLVGVVLFGLPLLPFAAPYWPLSASLPIKAFLVLLRKRTKKGWRSPSVATLCRHVWLARTRRLGRAAPINHCRRKNERMRYFSRTTTGRRPQSTSLRSLGGLPPSISAHNNTTSGVRVVIPETSSYAWGAAAKTCSRSMPQSRQWAKPIIPGTSL